MWRDSCEIIFAYVSSPVHMSKTWPGKLLKATGFRGMLIVAIRCCYLRRNRKEIFRLHTQSSRVSTAFKRLLPWASYYFNFGFIFLSLAHVCQPFNQSVLLSRLFFYFCIFFKLLDYVLVGEKSAIQIWSMIYIIIVLITFVEVRA